MNTDPLRPEATDQEPVIYLEPLLSDRPAAVIGYLFAAASGFIVGVLLMLVVLR